MSTVRLPNQQQRWGNGGHGPDQSDPVRKSLYSGKRYSSASQAGVKRTMEQQAANNEKFIPFFGLPNAPTQIDPYQATIRDHYTLPEVFKGSRVYMSNILIKMVRAQDVWMLTEMLPWKMWEEGMEIVWDEWNFHSGIIGRTPEESVSRLLTSSFRQDRAYIVRYGIALMLEHGFMKTDTGRQAYQMGKWQIALATVETLCHGAMLAVLNPPGERFANTIPGSANSKARREALLQAEVANWGRVHKDQMGVYRLLEDMRVQLSDQSDKRFEGNLVIVCRGMASFLAMQPVARYYFLTGLRTRPEAALKAKSIPGVDVQVRESVPFSIGHGLPRIDPMEQARSIGSKFQMTSFGLQDVPLDKFKTTMMDTYVFSEPMDDFVLISYAEMLRLTPLFKADDETQEWDLTKYGHIFFRSSPNWKHYMQSTKVLQRWTDQLLIHSHPRVFADFYTRFVVGRSDLNTDDDVQRMSQYRKEVDESKGAFKKGNAFIDGNRFKEFANELQAYYAKNKGVFTKPKTSTSTSSGTGSSSGSTASTGTGSSSKGKNAAWLTQNIAGVTTFRRLLGLRRHITPKKIEFKHVDLVELPSVGSAPPTDIDAARTMMVSLVNRKDFLAHFVDVPSGSGWNKFIRLSAMPNPGDADYKQDTMPSRVAAAVLEKFAAEMLSFVDANAADIDVWAADKDASGATSVVATNPSFYPSVFKPELQKAMATGALLPIRIRKAAVATAFMAAVDQALRKAYAAVSSQGQPQLAAQLTRPIDRQFVLCVAVMWTMLSLRISQVGSAISAEQVKLPYVANDSSNKPAIYTLDFSKVTANQAALLEPLTFFSGAESQTGDKRATRLDMHPLALQWLAEAINVAQELGGLKATSSAAAKLQMAAGAVDFGTFAAQVEKCFQDENLTFEDGDPVLYEFGGDAGTQGEMMLDESRRLDALKRTANAHGGRSSLFLQQLLEQFDPRFIEAHAGSFVVAPRLYKSMGPLMQALFRKRVKAAPIAVSVLKSKDKALLVPDGSTAAKELQSWSNLVMTETEFERLMVIAESIATEPFPSGLSTSQMEAAKRHRRFMINMLFAELYHGDKLIDIRAEISKHYSSLWSLSMDLDTWKKQAGYGKLVESLRKTVDVFATHLLALGDTYLFQIVDTLKSLTVAQWAAARADDRRSRRDAAVRHDDSVHDFGDLGSAREQYKALHKAAAPLPPSPTVQELEDFRGRFTSQKVEDMLAAMPIDSGRLVKWGLDNDMWPLLGVAGFRPHMTWIMGSVVRMQGGENGAGNTIQGHHDMQLGDDPIQKMHYAHWTFYAKPIVFRKEAITVAQDVFYRRYVNGYDTEIWNCHDRNDVADYADGFMEKSIFPVPLRADEKFDAPYADITGEWHEELGGGAQQLTNKLHYAAAKLMCKVWGWSHWNTALNRPYHADDTPAKYNTIVFQDYQRCYQWGSSVNGGFTRVIGCKGHLGRNFYPGVAQTRNGQGEPIERSADSGTKTVQMFY